MATGYKIKSDNTSLKTGGGSLLKDELGITDDYVDLDSIYYTSSSAQLSSYFKKNGSNGALTLSSSAGSYSDKNTLSEFKGGSTSLVGVVRGGNPLWGKNLTNFSGSKTFTITRTSSNLTINSTNYAKSSFSTGVVPYKIIVALQGAGGGGSGAKKLTLGGDPGGGGGAGGFAVFIVDFSRCSKVEISLGSGGSGGSGGSSGNNGGTGGTSYIKTYSGTSTLGQVYVFGGSGGSNDSGGSGGSVSTAVSHASLTIVKSFTGKSGGAGLNETAGYGTAGGTQGSESITVNSSSFGKYSKTFGNYSGGGAPGAAGGGGASFYCAGGAGGTSSSIAGSNTSYGAAGGGGSWVSGLPAQMGNGGSGGAAYCQIFSEA